MECKDCISLQYCGIERIENKSHACYDRLTALLSEISTMQKGFVDRLNEANTYVEVLTVLFGKKFIDQIIIDEEGRDWRWKV